jgi:hypothetical protein
MFETTPKSSDQETPQSNRSFNRPNMMVDQNEPRDIVIGIANSTRSPSRSTARAASIGTSPKSRASWGRPMEDQNMIPTPKKTQPSPRSRASWGPTEERNVTPVLKNTQPSPRSRASWGPTEERNVIPPPKKTQPSPRSKSSWESLTEDQNVIPSPKKAQEKARRISSPFLAENSSPVVLPHKASPVVLSQKSAVNSSPFKHIQNQDSKSKTLVIASKRNSLEKADSREVAWPIPKKVQEKREAPPDITQSSSNMTDDENRAPESQESATMVSESPRLRTKRALRLRRTKRAPSPMQTTGLQNSLDAAKVVLEEEKSSAGSSSASTRSSLSNNELTNIAIRALTMTTKKGSTPSAPVVLPISVPVVLPTKSHSESFGRAGTPDSEESSETPSRAQSPGQKARPSSASSVSSVRKTRTVSNVSHQEARRALLTAAQKRREKTEAAKKQQTQEAIKVDPVEKETTQEWKEQAADRLGSKAARVLAMKNSTKALRAGSIDENDNIKEFDIATVGSAVSTHSVDSTKSRRLNHPAFASRSSPKLANQMDRPFLDFGGEKPPQKSGSTKPFSEELFSSFRHFNASKPSQPDAPVVSKSPGMCIRREVFFLHFKDWVLSHTK